MIIILSSSIDFFISVTRGYLPRLILSPTQSSLPPPSPPIRHDIPIPSRVPQPLPRTNIKRNTDQLTTTSEPVLINSSHDSERIYLNQEECRSSIEEFSESHAYASIDLEDSSSPEQVFSH